MMISPRLLRHYLSRIRRCHYAALLRLLYCLMAAVAAYSHIIFFHACDILPLIYARRATRDARYERARCRDRDDEQ